MTIDWTVPIFAPSGRTERELSVPTSHDVARLAGVSQATVSRALRKNPAVAEATRQRVVEAARTLNYTPSEAGRVLRTRSSRQVALVADLMNQLYPMLVPAIHDTLAQHDYRLVVLAEPPTESHVLERLLDRSVDGVILTTIFLHSELPHELRRHGMPFVYLNRIGEVVAADSAVVDNEAGGYRVGKLFADLGHRDVAAIFGPTQTSTGRDRETGFRNALADAGIVLPERRVTRGWFSFEFGEEGIRDLLARGKPPTAVFCGNDLIAAGALAELDRSGLSVPDDVTVVGFDDLPLAAWPWLSLTTMSSPLATMAEAATRLLLRRFEQPGDKDWHQEVFPTHLVERRSHAAPPVSSVSR